MLRRCRLSFRNVVLTLHLWAGLLASAFLLVLGLTGCLMVYERNIDHALNRRPLRAETTTQALPLGKLFAGLERAHPGYHVTDMAFSREPDVPYEMYLNPGGDAEGFVVAINQYNGRELGNASAANQFMNFVSGLHMHLLMEIHRETGKLIVGVASTFLLFLSCSGPWLWWRRKTFAVKWSAAPKRVNFDLHNALGAFCSIFLFCFSLTGIAFTGRVLNVWNTRTAPLGFKINRVWTREIHSGDIFGWPTRVLASVVSLALPILTITGTLIWWHKARRLVARDFESASPDPDSR